MLEVDNLWVHYGEAIAVAGINIKVENGSIVALVGANGAGKTTILRTISGLIHHTKGEIRFCKKKISGLRADAIVKLGITHCPENRHVFPNLNVKENLLMGAYLRTNKMETEKDIEWIFDLFPALKKRTKQMAATLSGGEQQMLVLGRAIMSRPKLLLLDEPSLGLSPLIVELIGQTISSFHKKGMTILLVEQNIRMALSLAQWGYVLETGKIRLEASAKELFKHTSLEEAYLGNSGAKPLNFKRGGQHDYEKEQF
ncbi:MAG: ABC transporter ATP-binding protein [Deltaproteobacteria bacterium]|nr:ABC transporter ATP-binding protein [Deltaproteobacteria bacterium]